MVYQVKQSKKNCRPNAWPRKMGLIYGVPSQTVQEEFPSECLAQEDGTDLWCTKSNSPRRNSLPNAWPRKMGLIYGVQSQTVQEELPSEFLAQEERTDMMPLTDSNWQTAFTAE